MSAKAISPRQPRAASGVEAMVPALKSTPRNETLPGAAASGAVPDRQPAAASSRQAASQAPRSNAGVRMPSNLAHREGGRTAGAAERRDHNRAAKKTEGGRKKPEVRGT